MRSALLLVCAVACAHRGGLHSGSISYGGLTRTYEWAGPDAGKHPLVIALHGRGGRGEGQAALSHLDEIARREGFIVVFPDGMYRSWADGRNATPASKRGVDDVGFVAALIDRFVADGRADPARVYATGMSNGAMMTYTLACRLADRLAAVAPVAGDLPAGMACNPAKPIPVLAFNGTDDPFVPYAGGQTHAGDVVSVEASLGVFAQADGCSAAPVDAELADVAPDDGTIARTRTWSCPDGVSVELVTIEHGGHTWPGGQQYAGERLIGKTSRDVDASEEIWRFFSRYHR